MNAKWTSALVLTAGLCFAISTVSRAAARKTQELSPVKGIELAVTIDVSKTGEPISKYIYGQFIEHLGRCIDGGVWAEMLQDRKFYYPIKQEFAGWSTTKGDGPLGNDDFPILVGSPWEVIGGRDIVEMVKQDSFRGGHTPQVHLTGYNTAGIAQNKLGLIKGKKYTGRIVLAGDPQAAPIKVSLKWNNDKDGRDTLTINKIESNFVTYPLRFEAGATTDNARLEIAGCGKGRFRIAAVSLMPADNIKGMRRDTLALLKQLGAPMYRWPGGCFVGGWDWRDMIGEPDRRPTRENPAWSGLVYNDFGVNEFIEFCRYLDTEPFIAVDSGVGSVQLAADLVEYCNGKADTPMGKLRAKNGHLEPFNVKWWAVGNEMFGEWQNGYVPLDQYVHRHNKYSEAMWKVDPSIKLIAVGRVGEWDERMLDNCAEYMHYISEHFYINEGEGEREFLDMSLEKVAGLGAKRIRRIANAHRRYRETMDSLKGKDIRIAMDEWNHSRVPHYYGELGCRFYLQDALGVAECLHEFYRQSDIIFMANYAQTVNVLGCIKTNRTSAEFATTGLPLKIYRHHFVEIPVEVTGEAGPLDVAAAWTKDRRALTIGIVNPTENEYELALDLKNAQLTGKGYRWLISGPGRMAYNAPGQEPQVTIEEKPLSGISNKLSVPPLSICLYKVITMN